MRHWLEAIFVHIINVEIKARCGDPERVRNVLRSHPARFAGTDHQVLLGNLEPVGVLRNGTPEIVREAIAACHRDAGANYIAGAGCEVCRDTPEANLRALCEYAHTAR